MSLNTGSIFNTLVDKTNLTLVAISLDTIKTSLIHMEQIEDFIISTEPLVTIHSFILQLNVYVAIMHYAGDPPSVNIPESTLKSSNTDSPL